MGSSTTNGLRIVGAGLPRTGTMSLKSAIQQLTGQPCYHMHEFFKRREDHLPLWNRVMDGDVAAADEIFVEFGAAIDWPASSCWRELADHYPDAVVILTHRVDAATWWRSADRTVWEVMRRGDLDAPFMALNQRMLDRFHPDVDDGPGAMAAYDRHLAEVRATIAPDRLIEMTPADGWAPVCAALGLPIPDEPYPHRNTSEEFTARLDGDG